jgi:DNA repair photolyase
MYTEDKPINGKAIYTPKGAALEYGRTGCNFYTGCPHECEYCYLKRGITGKALGGTEVRLKKCFKDEADAAHILRNELDKHLEQCQRYGIFLSFTTDPMIPDTIELTMQALLFLQDMGIPSYVLTKNADFIDYELFHTYMTGLNVRDLLHFGFTLTGRDDMEPKASLNADRIATMKRLKLHFGCHTWASIEPVIDFPSSLDMIAKALAVGCKHFKIGLLTENTRVCRKRFDVLDCMGFITDVTNLTRDKATVYWKQSVRDLLRTVYTTAAVDEILDLPNAVEKDWSMFDL